MEQEIIKLEAEIDLTKEPNECRVKKVAADEWMDFGYWLEVCGFMAYQAMKYKEWTEQQILDYSRNYIEKCIKDYKVKSNLKVN